MIADRKVDDGGARGIAKEANAIVISVDYRRAPEAKFPAAWDDALASYKWALANAAQLKGDPKKVALAGESAGGNLALARCRPVDRFSYTALAPRKPSRGDRFLESSLPLRKRVPECIDCRGYPRPISACISAMR